MRAMNVNEFKRGQDVKKSLGVGMLPDKQLKHILDELRSLGYRTHDDENIPGVIKSREELGVWEDSTFPTYAYAPEMLIKYAAWDDDSSLAEYAQWYEGIFEIDGLDTSEIDEEMTAEKVARFVRNNIDEIKQEEESFPHADGFYCYDENEGTSFFETDYRKVPELIARYMQEYADKTYGDLAKDYRAMVDIFDRRSKLTKN